MFCFIITFIIYVMRVDFFRFLKTNFQVVVTKTQNLQKRFRKRCDSNIFINIKIRVEDIRKNKVTYIL